MQIVDKETFQAEVLEGEGLILVDFFGDGCVPCQELLPDIEALSEEYAGKLKFCKINTTAARRLAISQKVLGLPTVAVYKGGQKLEEVTKEGATKHSVAEMIDRHLN